METSQPSTAASIPVKSVETVAPAISYDAPGWKPKVEKQDEEQHERWLLSYADFITLLMVLFMMLYALQLARNNDLASLTEKLKNEKPVPVEVNQTANQAVKRTEVLSRLQPLTSDGQIFVTERLKGVEIDLKSSLLFSSGDAQVLPASHAVLAKIAVVLRDYPDKDVMVEGHTDRVAIATEKFASNWELSSARAAAVVRQLVEFGIQPSRMVALGRADNVPATIGDSPEELAKNRRVTIFVGVD